MHASNWVYIVRKYRCCPIPYTPTSYAVLMKPHLPYANVRETMSTNTHHKHSRQTFRLFCVNFVCGVFKFWSINAKHYFDSEVKLWNFIYWCISQGAVQVITEMRIPSAFGGNELATIIWAWATAEWVQEERPVRLTAAFITMSSFGGLLRTTTQAMRWIWADNVWISGSYVMRYRVLWHAP